MEIFAPGVQATTTTEIYSRQDMAELTRDLISRAEEVRVVLNRYRPRNPYPRGWVPFEPLCQNCMRIGHAKALRIQNDEVHFECPCGHVGSSPLHLGKLNWRLEWPALWKLLQVDIEPFGKDHAAPGGSRESCKVIAETVLKIEAPFGIPYEWVGLAEGGRDMGDMDSSDFVGFGPKEWLAVSDPEVLRFLFAQTPIKRRIMLDLARVDAYHQVYDQAEAAHYAQSKGDEAMSYEISQLSPPPEGAPYQLAYRHAALLAQVAPAGNLLEWSLGRLRDSGFLERPLSPYERERIERRLNQSLLWADTYGPDEVRVELLESLPVEIRKGLSKKEKAGLTMLLSRLSGVPWNEESIKEAMIALTSGGDLPVSTKRFFASLYRVLLGKSSGPRAAPLLALLERDIVLNRLKEAGA